MHELPASTVQNTFYSVAEVRRADQAAIDQAGIPGYVLMCRAAQAALDFALTRFPSARSWLLLCGGGNNAGDGYALARLAAAQGISVRVTALVEPGELSGDARRAYDDFAAAGLTATAWDGSLRPGDDLVIDALLGSGLARPLDGDFRAVVEQVNRYPAAVLALDIPTGIHGDSGERLGDAVRADVTLSFVGLKTGLVLGAGIAHSGEVVFTDLDIPDDCRGDDDGVLRRLPEQAISSLLAPRVADAHKGLFGHVLIVGGGPGMWGAVRIAGEAALRSGAGLVSIATHPSHAAHVAIGCPELMVHPVSTASDLSALVARAGVIAIGPGLGQTDWSRSLFNGVVGDVSVAEHNSGTTLVIDADGLNLLAERGVPVTNAVITPHPGEAGRLLESESSIVQSDRLGALGLLAARYASTVVLKGAGTLVSAEDGLPWVCTGGNPGMASPGMGDALTGIIASLCAQGFSREAAAVAGVVLHARAGDQAAAEGERGMLATDLIEQLRSCVNPGSYREDRRP